MTQSPPRLTLEWLMPQELGFETHAVLYDADEQPDHVLALGHGGDEAEALLELWATLRGHDVAQDASAHVAEAFTRRTGKAPR